MKQVIRGSKTYYDQGNGYYGVSVTPGSADDTTMGQMGIHLEYMQYADESNPYVTELRTVGIPALRAEEEKKEIEKESKKETEKQSDPYQGQMCPHCHTVCYGDCQS